MSHLGLHSVSFSLCGRAREKKRTHYCVPDENRPCQEQNAKNLQDVFKSVIRRRDRKRNKDAHGGSKRPINETAREEGELGMGLKVAKMGAEERGESHHHPAA